MSITLSALQQQRRDTAANWTSANPTLLAGEIGVETDTGLLKIGDGSTAWTSLDYLPLSFEGYAANGIYNPAANQVALATNGTGRLFIDSSGNVAVSPNVESYPFTVTRNNPTNGNFIGLKNNATSGLNGTNIVFSQNTVDNWRIGQPAGTSAFVIARSTDGTNEYFRIDSSGRLLVGTTSATHGSGATAEFAGSNSNYIFSLTNDTASDSDGHRYSYLAFTGKQSGGEKSILSSVNGAHDGTADDTKGMLVFRTNSGSEGGTIPTERMRIDSSGRLLVGTTTEGKEEADNLTIADSGDCGLTLRSGTSNYGAIYFSDATSGAGEYDGFFDYHHGDRCFRFGTAQAERMRIDSSGSVGIGTSTTTSLGSGFKEVIVSGDTEGAGLQLQDTDGNVKAGLFTSDVSNFAVVRTITNHPLVFRTNNSERMRIDEVGDVLIGTNSILTQTAELRVYSSGACAQELAGSSGTYTTYSSGPNSSSAVARGFIGTANHLVASGSVNDLAVRAQNELVFTSNGGYERMRINSSGNVGIGTNSPSVLLDVEGTSPTIKLTDSDASGTPECQISGGGGDLVFEADRDNEKADTSMRFALDGSERMRIDSSGRLLVGVSSSYANSGADDLQVGNNSSSTVTGISLGSTVESSIRFADASDASAGIIEYAHASDSMRLYTSGTERMRIDSSGAILVDGTAVPSAGAGAYVALQGGDNNCITTRRAGTANRTHISFVNDNGAVGSITTSASATAFNTSSDYRLKENVVDISDGIARVKQLQPKRFNFIADDSRTVDGFLAHEAQTVVPEAVIGTHNEVDDDGNPVYQGIDQSKLVPLLTAALQEAIAKIETLESKVAALEAAN